MDDHNKAIDSKPAWSLNDDTIYFHRAVGGLKNGFQIWAIDANGRDLLRADQRRARFEQNIRRPKAPSCWI